MSGWLWILQVTASSHSVNRRKQRKLSRVWTDRISADHESRWPCREARGAAGAVEEASEVVIEVVDSVEDEDSLEGFDLEVGEVEAIVRTAGIHPAAEDMEVVVADTAAADMEAVAVGTAAEDTVAADTVAAAADIAVVEVDMAVGAIKKIATSNSNYFLLKRDILRLFC
jgi:hypothetical protein